MKQFWSKSLACLLCLVLLAGMLPMAALAEDNPPANNEVSLADAAADTPIEIHSAEDLKKIGTEGYPLNGSYVLAEDINLEGSSVNNPWKSIGNFTGTFDGAGHTISGLYLNAGSAAGPTDQGLGLFTRVGEGGTVKNLTVEGKIESTEGQNKPIGGIVGKNNGGTISSCIGSVYITGNINSPVGGIVGLSESGTIENCRNTGSIDVTGSSSSSVTGISGIVGTNNGTVENCENTGNVTVKGNADGTGGIVGRANDGSTVSNCRNSGSIDGNQSQTGGIVGNNTAPSVTAATPAPSAAATQAASQDRMFAIKAAQTALLRTATTPALSAAAATLAASWGITATAEAMSLQSKIATTPALSAAKSTATLGALWGKSQQAMSATAIT